MTYQSRPENVVFLNSSAHKLAEEYLNTTGSCFQTGDFDTFANHFHLPQEVETQKGQRQINTRDELKEVFQSVRDLFSETGITELVRVCLAAEYINEDTIVTTHESRMLAGTTLKKSPYPVISILRRIDGKWQFVHSNYAVAGDPELNTVLMGPPDT